MQKVEKEEIFNALCVNYTTAYYCDLMKDYIKVIKQKEFSHSNRAKIQDGHSYSEWIRYAYEHIIVKETAPDYLQIFDRQNLMERLRKTESFSYRHKTLPNAAGMEYFEIVAVKLYEDDHHFKMILGYQPVGAGASHSGDRQPVQNGIFAAHEPRHPDTAEWHNRAFEYRRGAHG